MIDYYLILSVIVGVSLGIAIGYLVRREQLRATKRCYQADIVTCLRDICACREQIKRLMTQADELGRRADRIDAHKRRMPL